MKNFLGFLATCLIGAVYGFVIVGALT